MVDFDITINIDWVRVNHAMAIANLVNLALVTFLIFFYPNVTILQVTAVLAWIFTIIQVVASKIIRYIDAQWTAEARQMSEKTRDEYK